MENQDAEQHPPTNEPPFKKKKSKKKHPQYSADIVYTRGNSVQTMPSLSKLLRGVTGVLGLQYVWEYRSPSKSVQPHYQCKLCSLSCVQHDITDHVKGWKHCYKYMKKTHSDKITFEEEDVGKDPSLKGPLRAAAAEVEKAEGPGQIKVILKEPYDVPSFRGLRSSVPIPGPPPEVRPMPSLLGPRYHNPRFPPHGGPFSDYPEEYEEPGFGGYAPQNNFSRPSMDQRPFSDGMGRRPPGDGNGFGPGGERGGYGRNELLDQGPGKMYPDEYQGDQMGNNFDVGPMNNPLDRGGASESSSLPNTLLTYLDTFRIENENDAQLVLKVTQKLTDVLMEYRLRSVSAGSDLNSLSMSNDDRYSSNRSGPPRYSDGPPRYYN